MASRRTVREYRELLSAAAPDDLPGLIAEISNDDRAGVLSALRGAERRLSRHRTEVARIERLYALEEGLRAEKGLRSAGVDEVGRGALAGPLTVAAVILAGERILGLDDSKRLDPDRRAALCDSILRTCECYSVGHAQPAEIDTLGMTRALRLAAERALSGMASTAHRVFTDGLGLGLCAHEEVPLVRGDSTVACIAAASIVAKVTRDAMMRQLAEEFPGYGLDGNKGYYTDDHLAAIRENGLTPIHRRSFAPCSDAPTLF